MPAQVALDTAVDPSTGVQVVVVQLLPAVGVTGVHAATAVGPVVTGAQVVAV